MATRIIECSARTAGLPIYPPVLREQTAMTAGAVSAQSAAFGAGTEIVIVDTDEAIHVRVGNDPTAATTSMKISAVSRAEFDVREGEKVAIRTV